jgi:hypothetical protein
MGSQLNEGRLAADLKQESGVCNNWVTNQWKEFLYSDYVNQL